LAQQRMTLSDLEWPFLHRAISAVAELLVGRVTVPPLFVYQKRNNCKYRDVMLDLTICEFVM